MKTSLQFLLLTAVIILFSCDRSSRINEPAAYSEYVAGYTTGVVSKFETVRIKLSGAGLALETGKELPPGALTFDPSVKGSAILYAEDLIVFKPEGSWPSGETITAKLDLGKIMDVPKKNAVFTFQFSIIQPSFSIYQGNIVSLGEKEKKMKRLEGRLVSADKMELDDVRKLVKAFSDDDNYKINWEEGSGLNEFYFSVDSIPRLEKSYTVTVKWDGSPLDIEQEGSFDYEIPSVYDFLYMGLTAGQGEDQYIDIILSDPVDPAQDLTGLVYIKEGDAIRVVTDNNIIRLYPSQRIEGERTLIIESSLRNDMRATLKERVSEPIRFEQLKPAAEFIGKGVIMPDPQGLFLPIRTVNLRAVDVLVFKIFENNIPYYLQENNFSSDNFYNFKQYGRPVYAKTVMLDEDKSKELGRWNNFSLDLTPLIGQDPAAVYRIKLYFRKEYSVYGCNKDVNADLSKFILNGTFPEDKMEEWDRPGWYSEYEWPDDYRWNERDNPCHNSYYINDRFEQKLLLSSKVGVTAKSADGKHFQVFTTDLITGEPMADVTVRFNNYQNQQVGEIKTGTDGHAEISLDNRPYFLTASRENQKTWLRLDDGTALSMSHFDISGEEVQKGLKGMIYGERGVWRPGDTLFLTFILDDSQDRLPENYPVQFDVTNSRGQVVFSSKNAVSTDGFYSYKVPTDPDAPTGNWMAKAAAGGAYFEKSLKVETVKPNRLKIKLDFNQEVLNMFSQKPEGMLEVKWLHGAVAPGVRTEVNLSFRKTRTAFKGYEKYTFENPATYFWSEERNIFNKELDNQGKARFSFELPSGDNAPGMLDAVFFTRSFEKGGDFSTDVFSRQYSPFKKYIGIYIPDGGSYKNMLETGKDHRVEVASLDWQGNPVSSRDLQVTVYRIGWRWWWSSGEEDLAYYVGSSDAELVYQGKVDAINGKGSFNLRIDYPDWGRFLVLVKDNEGGHQAGIPVYFDWPSYVNRAGRANPAGATMLTFTADKEKYRVGENAVISFPAIPGSRALVSIESGSRVLSSQWKMCQEQEETFEIPVTEGMAPNVYVYLSVIQPHKQTENDLPIRMYGVIPLMIEDPSTILSPSISMPDVLKPEENFTVVVSERNGKPMTFTLAVVDEGLLDLTRYKTPDPHSVFYAREALGVKTWDMYDLVLGAFGGRLERVLAIGGDEEAMLAKNKKAQRFIPVVKFAGPFTVSKGGKKEITLKMPNYVGSVRTMVIAGKDGAYGMAEKTTPVKKPLMVLATLPRVLGPGEEFELPVSVFAMDENISKVTLDLQNDALFTVLNATGSLTFSQPGEQMAYFRLKVNEKTGIGKLKVTATSGSEIAFQEFEIEVRNPNPPLTKSERYVIEPGMSADIPYRFFGMEGSNSGKITFSGIPDFDLEKHLKYLIQYPYGCLEQTVSSVFPQLFLPELADLSVADKSKIDRNIREAINRISRLTMSDGSLVYWPGQYYYDSWATSYAGHFMIMAKNKGYLLPSGMLEKWTDFQYKTAGNYTRTQDMNQSWYEVGQAYRLYTLALAGKPNMSAMNRLRESGNLSPTTCWILATAYLYTGKPEVAQGLIAGLTTGDTDKYRYAGNSYGSELRDKAFMLEALILLKKDQDAFELMNEIATRMQNSYYSTQTTAFCLYSLFRFAGANPGKGFDFSLTAGNSSKQEIKSSKPIYEYSLKEEAGMNGNLKIRNNLAEGRLFVNVALTGQPLQGQEFEISSHLILKVNYKDDAGNLLDVSSLKQGTDFIAEVSVQHDGFDFSYDDLALSQVFPSGWEIVNTRVQDISDGIKEDAFEYRDYRDDRVYTFFKLKQYERKTFRVRLNAAYTGKYYLPATSCQAMYNENVQANNTGKWVMVVR